MKKERGVYILFLLVAILLISMISAGILDKIKTITGKAESPVPQNISITVVGVHPVVIEYIENIAPQQPTEADTPSPKTVIFEIRVTDPDGVADIDDSSVKAWFEKLGETSKPKVLCSPNGNIDTDTNSYLCSINMNYFDANEDWQIRAEASDFGNKTLIEDVLSVFFTYQELKAMTNSQPSLTWPNLVPGETNKTANNDPAIITNTGNYEGNVKITAYDLIGVDLTPFPANRFTIGETEGGECNAPATAKQMSDSATTIVATTLGGGTANSLYYCITTIPLVPTQSYSTTTSWRVVYDATP